MNTTAPPLIELRGVGKYFGNIIALKDITTSVGSGAVNAPGSALQAHGATLFSIHPNRLAPAERRVIATWGCCVEQPLVLEIGWLRCEEANSPSLRREAAGSTENQHVHADWM